MVAVAKPSTKAAYKLMHEGSLALARAEAAGIRIDMGKLAANRKAVQKIIAEREDGLKQTDVWRTWRKRFGSNANLGSLEQMSTILFDVLGYKPPEERTRTKRIKMDIKSLEKLEDPFTQAYLGWKKFLKLENTNFSGIARLVCPDGYIRPSFWLHNVITFRSSSSDPNFQNQPIRDPEIAMWIRSLFYSSGPNWYLLENDFKGAEVVVGSAYHCDPTMVKWLDTGFDMHKCMGGKCFFINEKDVPKPVRQQVKALFVFAEFYGSYYPQVAKTLWEACTRYKLVHPDGTPLHDHLKRKGITGPGTCEVGPGAAKAKPGTLEHHIQKLEKVLWDEWFPGYRDWKRRTWQQYTKDGYLHTLTGFTIQGIYSRNEVLNSPIQGSSFHCLLWCLIEVTKELLKRKMRSKIVGQIHDSIISDVHKRELHDYLALVQEVVTVRLPAHYPWLRARLDVEAELCPQGGNWYEKKEIDIEKFLAGVA